MDARDGETAVMPPLLLDQGAPATTQGTGRSPETTTLLRHFAWSSEPEPRRSIGRECSKLAHAMLDQIGDGPQLWAALERLLDAKEWFVRAAIDGAEHRP